MPASLSVSYIEGSGAAVVEGWWSDLSLDENLESFSTGTSRDKNGTQNILTSSTDILSSLFAMLIVDNLQKFTTTLSPYDSNLIQIHGIKPQLELSIISNAATGHLAPSFRLHS